MTDTEILDRMDKALHDWFVRYKDAGRMDLSFGMLDATVRPAQCLANRVSARDILIWMIKHQDQLMVDQVTKKLAG